MGRRPARRKADRYSRHALWLRISPALQAALLQYTRERGNFELRKIVRSEGARTLLASALRAWAEQHPGSQVARYLDDWDRQEQPQPVATAIGE